MNGGAFVHIRGTKRDTRKRDVPMMFPFQVSLLAFALENAEGADGLFFAPWPNDRRDLHRACRRAGIAPCSPNDLRRTFSNWMVEAGVPLFLIQQMMGHKDSRMLERVYGRQRPEQVAAALARLMGHLPAAQSNSSPRWDTGVSMPVEIWRTPWTRWTPWTGRARRLGRRSNAEKQRNPASFRVRGL